MGRWAQRQKRGGGGLPSHPNFSLVLAFAGPDGFTWTWDGPDPDSWSIQSATSTGGPWTERDNVGGSSRADAGFSPIGFYTVIGEDPGGNPITDRSNAVPF